MTDQGEPCIHQEDAKLAAAARQWTRRAVLDIVSQSGGRTVARPMFSQRPDLHMTTTDAEPMAGIQAVRQVEHAARRLTCEYVRQAREDGHTWEEIGAALDLSASAAHRGVSLAEAAYDDIAATPTANTPAATAGRSPGDAPPARPWSAIKVHAAVRPKTSRVMLTAALGSQARTPLGNPSGTTRGPEDDQP